MKYIRATFRFILFLAATFGLYGIWRVGAFFYPNKPVWRQTIFGAWARSFVRISNMRIEVEGRVPEAPFFLVSNHLSYTDVAALRAVAKGVFVAKSEIESWFAAGTICRDMGAIFINRQNRRDIPRAGGKIIERLKMGEGVIVFPEGTSTKGETVLPFNSSFLEFAARTDLPVSYAAISYATANNNPSASKIICWWEDISFGAHLFRLFQLREFTAVISFGDEPIMKTDRKELAQTLRQKVEEKFVPVL
ncbi:MAG: 1-acyl-sn-glycerol-3-phosphate acyltransferase [Acidobacteriota bacterium]|nr:1-acyl-sn-glycerol-3-phosphate acyltransferase [Acidobacteriota bacterium]